MQYRIIASDLDGTLLHKGVVSRENWKAIEALHEMGIHFVPASGRSFYEMPEELRDSPLIRYYITSDGVMIYDKQEDRHWEVPLPKALGHWVLDRLYAHSCAMMLHADSHSYVDRALHQQQECQRYHMSQSWIDFIRRTNVPVPDMRKFAYDLEVVQMLCVFFQEKAGLEDCLQTFRDHPQLLVAQSDPWNLEVFSRQAGKGNAVLLLAEKLGVDRKATIAVGDSTNDATMIQAAGLGLAMENAVPALKEMADGIICKNSDHAIAYILKNVIQ